MQSDNVIRKNERGNVLFLILIAVALFAALSYAVTQSTRSGGGDASNETKLIDVSQLLTTPTVYRSVAQRMILSQGVDGGGIIAIDPNNFSGLTAEQRKHDIYHPEGGGMAYPIPPKNMMDPNYDTNTWALNSENEVKNIGTTTAIPDETSVELMVFLPGLKKSVCEGINKKLGIPLPIPISNADASMNASSDPPTYMENGGLGVIGSLASDAQLVGKAEGCFLLYGTTDMYVFYSVLLDR